MKRRENSYRIVLFVFRKRRDFLGKSVLDPLGYRKEIERTMWLKKKTFHGKTQTFLRPEKVESIQILDYPYGLGDGAYFSIRIDGVEYVSCQKLNFPAGTGICFLESSEGKEFYCDDSIIIAALSRFWITYQMKLEAQWLERGSELPLLSRLESRKYLKWHKIPYPGVEW